MKTGAAFPSPAPYLWLFGLTSGTSGVYSCNHSPTCTSNGQWVGPLGSGSGSSCTGCADQALDNLAAVAIAAALTPSAGSALQLGYPLSAPQTLESDVNINGSSGAGSGNPSGVVNLNGGSGIASSVNGGKVNIAGGPGGNAGNGGDVDISGGAGADAGGSTVGNGGNINLIAGYSLSGGTGNGGNINLQAGLQSTSTSVTETWTNCTVWITCNWLLNGGTESLKLSTNGYYWAWVVAGVSQVTVTGCPTAMNGTYTVASVTTGGSGSTAYVILSWSNSGANLCGSPGSVTGTYGVSSGTAGQFVLGAGGAVLGSCTHPGGISFCSGTSGTPGEVDIDTFGSAGLLKVWNGNVWFGGILSTYNGIATVENGVPAERAEFNLAGTAQTANISGTLIASASGKYRIDASAVIKIAAAGGSPSSTLPALSVTYTDADTGGSVTQTITQTSSANTVGTISSGRCSSIPRPRAR